MYQRARILQALDKAGLNKSRKLKVRQFMQYLADNPTLCWEDAAREFQANYLDIIDDIVPPILDTNDPLIIANLLKYLDLKSAKSLRKVKTYIQKANAYEQPRVFMHMAKYYHATLGDALDRKKRLPETIRTTLKILDKNPELAVSAPLNARIEIFLGKDRQHYFHLILNTGDIILVSEGYKSKASCRKGVKSIQKNAGQENNYIRKASRDGKHYFVLLAANKKIIATGIRYASAALRDKAIAMAQTMAPHANILALAKQIP
jgi:uncharacterized protein